jgi:hypothetical protein
MTLPSDVAGWQNYLEEHFPEGVQFNWLDASGALAFPSRMLSMLKVVSMQGAWPVLVGFDLLQEDQDVWLYVASWKEIDRHGHHVVRVTQSGSDAASAELSSWIDPEMATELARVRPEDEKALAQLAAAFGDV